VPPKSAAAGNDREPLWSVSAKRLPYYFLVCAPLVVIASIVAVSTASGKFWTAVFTVSEQIAALCAAAFGLVVMVEGLLMGMTKIIIERAREQAKTEGIQQGIQQERDRLRQHGVPIPPETKAPERSGKTP
jgi:hypothetical protein